MSAPAQTSTRKIDKRGISNTPETLLGERLFLETRFAQYFAVHSENINQPLAQGDPVVDEVRNPRAGVAYPSPFAGRSINCRSCHFVDEFSSLIAGVNRSYVDFLPRSPIPDRGDHQSSTSRNSRSLVDVFLPGRTGVLLHGDGEFANVDALIKSTLAGRDFGWLPNEQTRALHHIAKVIREDDGSDDLGQQYGGSYAKLMLATAGDLTGQNRLSEGFRIDVSTATDAQIVNEVSRLIAAYLVSLQLERDVNGSHTGSAYDMFLAKNGLPAKPDPDETDAAYSQRLLENLEQLQHPRYVLPYDRWLRFHPHVFEFGELELEGLKLFLRRGSPSRQTMSRSGISPFLIFTGLPLFGVLLAQGRRRLLLTWIAATFASVLLCAVMTAAMNSSTANPTQASSVPVTHVGNCVTCHSAPEFTDFRFHNTGAAQEEYDAIHGAGSFARLPVPTYAERSRAPNRYLPATSTHPLATETFRSIPEKNKVSATDLGVWNVFANPDYAEVQKPLQQLLCGEHPCDPARELPRTIALFRTPSLRNLGHSAPYLHTGRMGTVEDVLRFYFRMAHLARAGQLRNGDPELVHISLDDHDMNALAAFLRSLDEDYDN